MFGLGAPELLIILLVVLIVFGGTQIPKLARSLGQAQKEFKQGLDEGAKESPAGWREGQQPRPRSSSGPGTGPRPGRCR
jgi:sec-independent protein translocase protein TatA